MGRLHLVLLLVTTVALTCAKLPVEVPEYQSNHHDIELIKKGVDLGPLDDHEPLKDLRTHHQHHDEATDPLRSGAIDTRFEDQLSKAGKDTPDKKSSKTELKKSGKKQSKKTLKEDHTKEINEHKKKNAKNQSDGMAKKGHIIIKQGRDAQKEDRQETGPLKYKLSEDKKDTKEAHTIKTKEHSGKNSKKQRKYYGQYQNKEKKVKHVRKHSLPKNIPRTKVGPKERVKREATEDLDEDLSLEVNQLNEKQMDTKCILCGHDCRPCYKPDANGKCRRIWGCVTPPHEELSGALLIIRALHQ